MKNVYQILKERGFIEQCTDEEGLGKLLGEGPQTFYCGFDPTASSMHIGNLIPVMALRTIQRAGHKVIVLTGGATGMIGDPSGKSEERNFLSEDDLKNNLELMAKQFGRFISFEEQDDFPAAIMVNNFDWTKDVTIIEWLRDIGKQFSVNMMVNKESVRRRFEDRDQGISYTEFSYMLLQAFDFDQLYKMYGCRVQVGGKDQWGNITSGIDLIRRNGGEQAFGFTLGLLLTASGEKFGKSQGGAIFIDPELTSIWDLYQFYIRSDDKDVIKLLKLFSDLPIEEIEELAKQHEENPGKREAHKRLAYEATKLIHGTEQAEKMVKGAEALYAGRLEELDADLISQVFKAGPVTEVAENDLSEGVPLVDLVADSGLVKSKGEAKRMMKQGALYINDKRAENERVVTSEDILPSQTVILRKGKRDYCVVKVK